MCMLVGLAYIVEETFFGGTGTIGGGLEQYFLSTSSNKSSMSSAITRPSIYIYIIFTHAVIESLFST